MHRCLLAHFIRQQRYCRTLCETAPECCNRVMPLTDICLPGGQEDWLKFIPSFVLAWGGFLSDCLLPPPCQVLAFHAEYQVTSKAERRRAWAITELGHPLVPDDDAEASPRTSGGGGASDGADSTRGGPSVGEKLLSSQFFGKPTRRAHRFPKF